MRKVLRSVLATVDAAFASDAESSPTALFVGELTKEISCPDAPAELGPLVYRKKERFEDLAVSVRELGPRNTTSAGKERDAALQAKQGRKPWVAQPTFKSVVAHIFEATSLHVLNLFTLRASSVREVSASTDTVDAAVRAFFSGFLLDGDNKYRPPDPSLPPQRAWITYRVTRWPPVLPTAANRAVLTEFKAEELVCKTIQIQIAGNSRVGAVASLARTMTVF